MNILYVDDEVDIIDVAKVYFNDLGISIDTASSAGEAFELMKKKNYSVIISDARMPEMDGLTFNKILREEIRFSGGFILVTGFYDYNDARSFPRGIDKVLVKPIEFDELKQCIDQLSIKGQ